jgi:hypothetical protein
MFNISRKSKYFFLSKKIFGKNRYLFKVDSKKELLLKRGNYPKEV